MTIFADFHTMMNVLLLAVVFLAILTEIKTAGMGVGAIIGLANAMVPGVLIGIVGLGMALSTYPIYKKILNARKKKYAPEILALSEKIAKS